MKQYMIALLVLMAFTASFGSEITDIRRARVEALQDSLQDALMNARGIRRGGSRCL